ncbi:DUF6508 domain-containing protein [Lederbergia lenta]|uniref:Uncharacterized protein n=1 Tax=Lederbergia lenta TaxID=1467 RepID=A0A2X4VNA8_LEDLE|nr:DUF6508 domain-containing protein [Lederbergia lenta]MCM3110768.1 DUF6508 domain-containing protein [Lederbergia lenta]MEC2325837.1 DUF6508 domain-containing protein [Lederbergia lenta]SQI53677.1 Uncharacterised protein [Lederbergia lenta]
MGKYQSVIDYISYFKNVTEEEACYWGGGDKRDDGIFTISYPVYDKQLTSFIEEVTKTDLLDSNYISTLEKYGLPMTMSDEIMRVIHTSNEELTKAILTAYIRQERFNEGLWATAVKDKVFYKLLIRLQQLEDKL